ncbi:MAG: hypothetical protein LW817_03455 [Candidatus Caenarcaniphilales bacterium]|nr:hypothetical protein [Candidatus Caenarcaniphilales bacterium]
MPNKKRAIIIPGSCSSRANWFDNIVFFEKHNYQADFIELEAFRYEDLDRAAIAIFDHISLITRQGEKFIFLVHSMGAMLFLKILLDGELFSNRDPKTFEIIKSSTVVLIQIPIQVKQRLLWNFRISFPFISVGMFLHRPLISSWLSPLLIYCKKLEHKYCQFALLNLALNVLLMHSSFWGTRVKEYINLIKYYEHWDAYSLSYFFLKKINEASEFSNLIFTTGNLDMFNSREHINEIAAKLNAKTIDFPWSFHNPHHFFWTQKPFHDYIATVL